MSCIIELDENLSPLKHFPVNSEIEYLKTNNRLRIISYCHSFEPSSTGSRKVKKTGYILRWRRQMPNSLLLSVTSIKMENGFYVAGVVGKGQECIYLMKSTNGF